MIRGVLRKLPIGRCLRTMAGKNCTFEAAYPHKTCSVCRDSEVERKLN